MSSDKSVSDAKRASSNSSPVASPPTEHVGSHHSSRVAAPPEEHGGSHHSSPVAAPPEEHGGSHHSSPVASPPTEHGGSHHSSPVASPPTEHVGSHPSSPVDAHPEEHGGSHPSSKSASPELTPEESERITERIIATIEALRVPSKIPRLPLFPHPGMVYTTGRSRWMVEHLLREREIMRQKRAREEAESKGGDGNGEAEPRKRRRRAKKPARIYEKFLMRAVDESELVVKQPTFQFPLRRNNEPVLRGTRGVEFPRFAARPSIVPPRRKRGREEDANKSGEVSVEELQQRAQESLDESERFLGRLNELLDSNPYHRPSKVPCTLTYYDYLTPEQRARAWGFYVPPPRREVEPPADQAGPSEPQDPALWQRSRPVEHTYTDWFPCVQRLSRDTMSEGEGDRTCLWDDDAMDTSSDIYVVSEGSVPGTLEEARHEEMWGTPQGSVPVGATPSPCTTPPPSPQNTPPPSPCTTPPPSPQNTPPPSPCTTPQPSPQNTPPPSPCTTPQPSPHSTPPPSPCTTPQPSPHSTPPPSPHSTPPPSPHSTPPPSSYTTPQQPAQWTPESSAHSTTEPPPQTTSEPWTPGFSVGFSTVHADVAAEEARSRRRDNIKKASRKEKIKRSSMGRFRDEK